MVEVLALNPEASMDRVQVAIARLRQFEPPEGYWLAFSGGKDSQTLYHLAIEAGVKFNAHYNISLEPPELKQFIRQQYPEVAWEKMPNFNFYEMIVKKGFPLRQARWCCEYMKEWGGGGRTVLTGVRWQESTRRRKNRKLVDRMGKSRFNALKVCVNPIIDWSLHDVWGYLRERGIPHCSLYDEGFKRLGCTLCPMATNQEKRIEAERWPKVALAWLHAFERLYAVRLVAGNPSILRWKSGREMFDWYINKSDKVPKEQYCFAFE